MRIISLAILSALLFSGCLFSKKRNKTEKPPIITRNLTINQQALIVGVNDYKGTDKDLVGIDLDVEKMNKLFTSWGFEVKILQDSKSMDFQKSIVEYANTLKTDDVFILYFSGHGSSTVDRSGDELNDDRDELMVISDGMKNLFILDDNIDKYLDKIEARKLIIFDSCNSGTVNRSYVASSDNKVKYIPAPADVGDSEYDGSIPMQSFLTPQISGPSLFFAACRDNEKSLTSKNGSLFTNTFLSYISIEKSAKLIHQQTLESLSRSFHPTLSASNELLKNSTLKSYLKIKVD